MVAVAYKPYVAEIRASYDKVSLFGHSDARLRIPAREPREGASCGNPAREPCAWELRERECQERRYEEM